MGYVEVDRTGRMQVVSSSKKKSEKSSKSRKDEPVYVVDEERESELLSNIDNLKLIIAQFKEENKNLRKIAHDSEQVSKAWKAEAQEYKAKFEAASTAKMRLDNRITRRDDEVKALEDDRKKFKNKVDELVIETIRQKDTITILKDDVRRLKEDNVRLAVKEDKLKDEINVLTRLLATDRDNLRRNADEPRRGPYNTDRWDNLGPLPFRDNLRPRWGGRDYEG